MGHVGGGETGGEELPETTSFNAEMHLSFMGDIFPFYGQDFDDWCLCMVADNSATNKRIPRLVDKTNVGSASHKLNLEVNRMVSSHCDLNSTIESVQKAMLSARQLNNAALLRNLTVYRPVTHNAARWYGKVQMLRRFSKIRAELIEVSDAPMASLRLTRVHGSGLRCSGRIRCLRRSIS